MSIKLCLVNIVSFLLIKFLYYTWSMFPKWVKKKRIKIATGIFGEDQCRAFPEQAFYQEEAARGRSHSIVFHFHPPFQPRCPCRLGPAMRRSWSVRWPPMCTTFSKGNLRLPGRPTYHVLHLKGIEHSLFFNQYTSKNILMIQHVPYTCIIYGTISLPRTGHEKMLALKNIISARLKDRTDQCSVGIFILHNQDTDMFTVHSIERWWM